MSVRFVSDAKRLYDARAVYSALVLQAAMVAATFVDGVHLMHTVRVLVPVMLMSGFGWVAKELSVYVSIRRIELMRMLVNNALLLWCGYELEWSLVMWAWPVYAAAVTERRLERVAVMNFITSIVLFDVAGVTSGAPWSVVLGSNVLALVCFVLSDARVRMMEEVLEHTERQYLELRAAREQLELLQGRAIAQEKMSSLGLVAAGIAHEINNPMSFVTANVRALVQDLSSLPTDPELMEEYRAQVLPSTVDGLKRIEAIVRDLRRFSRADTERLVKYDLNQEIRSVARIVEARSQSRCALELELQELPQLLGHPRLVNQLVLNLMINATQAIPTVGVVTVKTAPLANGAVSLSVIDTGTGMTDETRSQLFQPFFTTKPVGEGTGLGLAVVQDVVRSHGGEITVHSKLGEGTCFTIVLPKAPPPASVFALTPRVRRVSGIRRALERADASGRE